MSAFPILPIFTDIFIADTGHLSAQETGAYFMLMMIAWRSPECRLPDNDDKLARWARVDRRTWVRIKPAVMEFWTLADGFWSQKRLSKEREFVSKRAEVNRKNGQQGGRPKSLKNNDTQNPAGSVRDSETKAPTLTPTPTHNRTPKDANASSAPKGARRVSACLCPDDFEPSEAHFAKAREAGQGREFVAAAAQRMRHWSHANANRPVARKSDWNLAFHGFLDRALGELPPARQQARASPPAGRSSPGSRLLDRMEARRAQHHHETAQGDHGPVLDYESDGGPYREVHEPAGGQAGRLPTQASLRLVGSGGR